MMIKIKLAFAMLLIVSSAALLIATNKKTKSKNGNMEISLSTFQTSIGWGYKIDINKKTFVYQPFIPVIETHTGFVSKELAERVGNLVMNKIIQHKQPSLTLHDLMAAGVNIEMFSAKKIL